MTNNFILPLNKSIKPKTVQTEKKVKKSSPEKQVERSKLHQILV